MSHSNSISLPPRVKDLTGGVFGRLSIVGYAGLDEKSKSVWTCKCSCGNTKQVKSRYLMAGDVTSCGCFSAERKRTSPRTHGMRGTPEYAVWAGMWQRCANPNNKGYQKYKDRAPPPEWRAFETFYAELGPRPEPGFSLDRIDNSKPYGPGNCRWATPTTQNNNQGTNRHLLLEGEFLTFAEACRTAGVSQRTFYDRLRRGVPPTEAIKSGRLRKQALEGLPPPPKETT